MKTKKVMLRLGALLTAVMMLAASPADVYATNAKNSNGNENGNLDGTGGAAAGSTIDPEAKGSLTIYKYDKKIREAENFPGSPAQMEEEILSEYAVKGVEFTYYKAAGFGLKETETVNDAEERVTAIVPVFSLEDNTLKTILGLESGKTDYTTTELNRALGDIYGKLDSELTEKKNAFENYISGSGAPKGTAMTPTDEEGKTLAENLTPGLYLVVETKVPTEVVSTVNPFFVSIPMTNAAGNGWEYDVTVYPKNQLETQEDKPTLKKEVRKAAEDPEDTGEKGSYGKEVSASGWDKLEYRVVSRVPVITSTATYLTKYQFTDEMGRGLKYVEDSFRINFYDPAEDDPEDIGEENRSVSWEGEDAKDYFTITLKESGTGRSVVIEVTEEGLEEMNPACSGKYMVIEYQAELTEEAVPGEANTNRVSLKWKRTNGEEEEIRPDPEDDPDPEVYTYGIRLAKSFQRGEIELDIEEEGLDATKVGFLLQKGENYIKAEVHTEETSGEVSAGEEAVSGGAVYRATGLTADREEATEFRPGADGILYICGLEEGTYSLSETETLRDYALLVNDVEIKITKADTVGSKGFLEVEVINHALPYMLNTGGMGIVPFLLGGGILILAGGVLLWRRRKIR